MGLGGSRPEDVTDLLPLPLLCLAVPLLGKARSHWFRFLFSHGGDGTCHLWKSHLLRPPITMPSANSRPASSSAAVGQVMLPRDASPDSVLKPPWVLPGRTTASVPLQSSEVGVPGLRPWPPPSVCAFQSCLMEANSPRHLALALA